MSTCYIYIWHHENEDLYWGFYNLCIWGSYVVGGKTLINPVFSYCPDSKLRIYPHGKAFRNYPADVWPSGYDVWRCTFYSDKVNDFISSLSATVDSDTFLRNYTSSTDYYLECYLKETIKDSNGNDVANPFHAYDEIHHNSFEAVARWVGWLGNMTLLGEYTDAHSGVNDSQRFRQYIPSALYNKYGSSWQKIDYDDDPSVP